MPRECTIRKSTHVRTLPDALVSQRDRSHVGLVSSTHPFFRPLTLPAASPVSPAAPTRLPRRRSTRLSSQPARAESAAALQNRRRSPTKRGWPLSRTRRSRRPSDEGHRRANALKCACCTTGRTCTSASLPSTRAGRIVVARAGATPTSPRRRITWCSTPSRQSERVRLRTNPLGIEYTARCRAKDRPAGRVGTSGTSGSQAGRLDR